MPKCLAIAGLFLLLASPVLADDLMNPDDVGQPTPPASPTIPAPTTNPTPTDPPVPAVDAEPPPPAPPRPTALVTATPAVVVVAPAPKPAKAVCMQGLPKANCDSVFLFEVGYRNGTSSTFTFDVGVLLNHGKRNAFGLTVGYLGFEGHDDVGPVTSSRGAYKARYRRYLGGKGAAFDVGVGGGKFGAVGEVAIGYRDIISLSAGMNTFRDEDRNIDVAANVGVRLGTTGILAALYGLASLAGGAR